MSPKRKTYQQTAERGLMWWINKIPWLVFGAIAILLGWCVVAVAEVQQAGDIAEYYGVTESLKNHGSVELTGQDRNNLEQVLHPAYFEMTGYYVAGRDGERYPVHFWVYSLLAVPFRWLLELLGSDPRRSLLLVNWASVTIAVGYIMRRYLGSMFYRLALMGVVFSGAMMSFLVWPGPDLWYLSVFLVAVFAWVQKDYWRAAVLTAMASWHSQPLVVLALGMTGYAIYRSIRRVREGKVYLLVDWRPWISGLFVGVLAAGPYVYNLVAFGILTPWTQLKDGWTIMRGFGIQNMSLWKLWEQWFDLNIGLFWYAPVVFVLGIWGLGQMGKKDRRIWMFCIMVLVTAFFYQTNPAWHYGTVGYGPGRHGVFLLPLLMAGALQVLQKRGWRWLVLLVLMATQFYGLSFNGWLEPDFTKTLDHSPMARWVLDRWPQLYNPTPEIFVDRTNHTDLGYPTSAVYMVEDRCVKAYVLLTDKQWLVDRCGGIPESANTLVDNPFGRKANYERRVTAREVTFWPDPDACSEWFVPTSEMPFGCMRDVAEVMKATGLADLSRLTTVAEFPYPGIWKVPLGDPVSLRVPAGYIINYVAVDGVYVTYPI